MDKDHPSLKKHIGEKDKWGDTMDADAAVLHHIREKYGM